MSALPLPPALAPWTPWLELFPAELALSLGPMIQRLAAAIGPFATPAQSGHGEPDGFSGLDRRGTYERLLASEWLLAELAPDEFLRRAASAEHAFLRLERREPALARTSVVLFDAGPAQLGGPRLAHLAALVAFARRAGAAHASLAWGLLQEPDVPLVREITRETVRALLARRTAVSPAAAHRDAWRARLPGHVSQDTWIIGGPTVAAHAWPGAATIALRDLVTAGPPELAAVLRTVTGRTADVRLPLPEGPSCVRLIRDPFPPEPPAPIDRQRRRTRHVPVGNLVITPNGERVFAGARGRGIIAYPVPHSPNGGLGKPKLHFSELSRAPSAVGWYNRGVAAVAVMHDGAAILFRKARRSASALAEVRYHCADLPLKPSDELRLLRFRGDRTFFHDGADRLFSLGETPDRGPHIECIAEQTIAVASVPKWLAHVTLARLPSFPAATPEMWAIFAHHDEHPIGLRRPLGVERPHAAHFARTATDDWLCALTQQPGRWELHSDKVTGIEWTTDDRVIGLLAPHYRPGLQDIGPALVTLTSERDFLARGHGATVHIHTADEPVVHAALSTLSGHLAYVTARGTVVVLRPPYDAPLARFTVEDA